MSTSLVDHESFVLERLIHSFLDSVLHIVQGVQYNKRFLCFHEVVCQYGVWSNIFVDLGCRHRVKLRLNVAADYNRNEAVSYSVCRS